jgi:hypothetical protein
MKVKQLMKKLQKLNLDAEVMIRELACDNVRAIHSVSQGWYVDDGFDAPEFIDEKQNASDYDIDPTQKKIVCLE